MWFSGLRSTNYRRGLSLLCSLVWVAALCTCSSVQPLEPSLVSKTATFLQVGVTTASEVEGRIGSQFSSYENGFIRIYHVSFDDRERLTLKQGWPCYALVLIFDGEGVLRRDALIKNGCGIREP